MRWDSRPGTRSSGCARRPPRKIEYLPEIAGQDWLKTFHDVMQNYRDESFLLQFLTPKLARDFRLMAIQTGEGLDYWKVKDTAGAEGFKAIRSRSEEHTSELQSHVN